MILAGRQRSRGRVGQYTGYAFSDRPDARVPYPVRVARRGPVADIQGGWEVAPPSQPRLEFWFTPDLMDSIEPTGAERSLLEMDIRELEEQVRAARSAARRHTLWAVLGVSPGAVIPLLLTIHELGMAVIGAFSVFVAGVESWRAIQARMDAAELQERLSSLSSPDRAPGVAPPRSGPMSSPPSQNSTDTPDS
jgi:hypothetical protein